jgi:valyl-tRNA synthetase
MPFVTEETWQHLKKAQGASMEAEALMIAEWPQADKKGIDARAEKEFAMVMDIVRAIRNARTEFNVEPGKRIPAIVSAGAARGLLEEQRELIASLARLDLNAFQVEKHAARPAQALALIVDKVEVYLPLAGMIDVEREKSRLTNEIAKVNNDIQRAENMLSGEFATRAPKEVVQRTRDQLAANRERMAKLDAHLASLDGREIAPAPVATALKLRKAPTRKAVKRTTSKSTTKKATQRTVRKTAKKTPAKRTQKRR